ncbi:MAG: alpha/beta hydrolase [Thermodesulfobacteriota bacterium]
MKVAGEMRIDGWLRVTLLLVMLFFAAAGSIGGCSGGGTGGLPGGGGDGGGAGIDIEPGGTLADEPETYFYVEGGTDRQTLDLYRIQDISSPRPALVWFHGGGWVINSKENIEGIAFDIAEAGGFHLVSVGYRLAGQGAEDWPGIVREVKSAVRWLKLNAEELGIDPDAIIVTGESAGAHLAAMVALSAGVGNLEGTVNPGASSDAAAAVLFYGPYDFNTIVDEALEVLLTGQCGVELNPLPIWALLECPVPGDIQDPLSGCQQSDLDEASPVTHVDAGDPPVFIAAGTDDCFVPWMQALDLEDALDAAGVTNEVSITEGGEHDADSLDVTPAQVIEFLSGGE